MFSVRRDSNPLIAKRRRVAQGLGDQDSGWSGWAAGDAVIIEAAGVRIKSVGEVVLTL